MMKAKYIITALAIAAAGFGASADLTLAGYNADGKVVKSCKVTDTMYLRFTNDGVDVYDGDATAPFATFWHNSLQYFKLMYDGAGVETPVQESALRLVENPVADVLTVTGHDGTPARLAILSLNGSVALQISQWQGETVNVSSLAPGLYILKIDNTTFKFIKK